jgi:hypothetical protein
MLENKQFTGAGDALQAGSLRFESAIAHKRVVNWKSMFYDFPFHSFLSAYVAKGVGKSGYIWVHLGTSGYIPVANFVANDRQGSIHS